MSLQNLPQEEEQSLGAGAGEESSRKRFIGLPWLTELITEQYYHEAVVLGLNRNKGQYERRSLFFPRVVACHPSHPGLPLKAPKQSPLL